MTSLQESRVNCTFCDTCWLLKQAVKPNINQIFVQSSEICTDFRLGGLAFSHDRPKVYKLERQTYRTWNIIYALLLRLHYVLLTLTTTVITSFVECQLCNLSTGVDFFDLQSICKFILQQKNNIIDLTRNQY